MYVYVCLYIYIYVCVCVCVCVFHVFCLCNFSHIHSNELKVWFNDAISLTSGIQIKQIAHQKTLPIKKTVPK